jgi:hypothetical protein
MDDPRQPDTENRVPFSARPVSVRRIRETDLERRAAQVGAAAGRAFAALREARKIIEDPGHGSAADRFHELGAAAKARTQELRREAAARAREAAARAEDWRRNAWDKTAELRAQARRGYDQARGRAKEVEQDHPLHVVVAAGIAGFLAGAAMRLGRSHRDR